MDSFTEEDVISVIQQFQAPNDQTIRQAEEQFEMLEFSSPDKMVMILISIIQSNINTNLSFGALIKLGYYISQLSELKNLHIAKETLDYLHQQTLDILINPNIAINVREYIMDKITHSFLTKLSNFDEFWPELIPFLFELLETPYRYLSLNFFRIAYFAFFPNDQMCYKVVNYIQLESDDPIIRAASIDYLVFFLNKYPSHGNMVEILPKLIENLPYDLFSQCIKNYMDVLLRNNPKVCENIHIQMINILLDSISNRTIPELYRVSSIFYLISYIYISESTAKFVLNSCVPILEIISDCLSRPDSEPDVYYEAHSFLEYLSFYDDREITDIFVQKTSNDNLYIASSFMRYLNTTKFFDSAMHFAFCDDMYLRENGLTLLNNMIIERHEEIEGEYYEIGLRLLQGLSFYKEEYLKTLAIWCKHASNESLNSISSDIFTLLQQNNSPDVVYCASLICSRFPAETIEFSHMLLNHINNQFVSGIDEIMQVEYLGSLPCLSRSLDKSYIIDFLNNNITTICQSFECITSEGLGQLMSQLGEQSEPFFEIILNSLLGFIQQEINLLNKHDIIKIQEKSFNPLGIYVQHFRSFLDQQKVQDLLYIGQNYGYSPYKNVQCEALQYLIDVLTAFPEYYVGMYDYICNLIFKETDFISFTLITTLLESYCQNITNENVLEIFIPLIHKAINLRLNFVNLDMNDEYVMENEGQVSENIASICRYLIQNFQANAINIILGNLNAIPENVKPQMIYLQVMFYGIWFETYRSCDEELKSNVAEIVIPHFNEGINSINKNIVEISIRGLTYFYRINHMQASEITNYLDDLMAIENDVCIESIVLLLQQYADLFDISSYLEYVLGFLPIQRKSISSQQVFFGLFRLNEIAAVKPELIKYSSICIHKLCECFTYLEMDMKESVEKNIHSYENTQAFAPFIKFIQQYQSNTK